MQVLTCSVLFCLGVIAVAAPARADDDVIINGQHCNSMCQAWLGVPSDVAKPTPLAPAPMLRREIVDAPVPLQLRPAAASRPTVPRASRLLTASREEGPTVVPSTAAEAEPSAARGADDHVLGSRSLPPAVGVNPPVFAPSPIVMVPVRPAVPRPSRSAALPVQPVQGVEPSPEPDILAEPDGLESRPGPVKGHGAFRNVRRRTLTATINPGMEPGLKDMPRLSDIVAVHGTIMVETAEDRVVAQRQRARLVQATTRPKEFRTGFATPLPDQGPIGNDVVGQAR